jgi:mono/diheme cytochrome c family protein
MLLAFVIFCGVVGLIVFLYALRRGSHNAAEEGTRSGVNQRLIAFGISLMFVFGLVVPAIVLVFNGTHKAGAAIGGVHLTKDEQKGRELFAHACGVCHTLAAVKSVGRTGPNLDYLVGKEITTAAARRALVLSTIANGQAYGLGNMPAELYVGKEAEDVAKFVAAVANR